MTIRDATLDFAVQTSSTSYWNYNPSLKSRDWNVSARDDPVFKTYKKKEAQAFTSGVLRFEESCEFIFYLVEHYPKSHGKEIAKFSIMSVLYDRGDIAET